MLKTKKELWLNLIKADSNERYDEIANTGSEIMSEAVRVIYDMSEDTRMREAARQREKALYDMYSSLTLAERRGRKKAAEEYESQLAEKDNTIAENKAQLAENKAQLAEKDDEIAQLKAMLREALAQLNQK